MSGMPFPAVIRFQKFTHRESAGGLKAKWFDPARGKNVLKSLNLAACVRSAR